MSNDKKPEKKEELSTEDLEHVSGGATGGAGAGIPTGGLTTGLKIESPTITPGVITPYKE